jgi:hypothetical protein
VSVSRRSVSTTDSSPVVLSGVTPSLSCGRDTSIQVRFLRSCRAAAGDTSDQCVSGESEAASCAEPNDPTPLAIHSPCRHRRVQRRMRGRFEDRVRRLEPSATLKHRREECIQYLLTFGRVLSPFSLPRQPTGRQITPCKPKSKNNNASCTAPLPAPRHCSSLSKQTTTSMFKGDIL